MRIYLLCIALLLILVSCSQNNTLAEQTKTLSVKQLTDNTEYTGKDISVKGVVITHRTACGSRSCASEYRLVQAVGDTNEVYLRYNDKYLGYDDYTLGGNPPEGSIGNILYWSGAAFEDGSEYILTGTLNEHDGKLILDLEDWKKA